MTRPAGKPRSRSGVAIFHPLEPRRLLHGAVDVAINFQPASAETPHGYFADVGRPFGDRGPGLSYGWRRDSGPWTNTWTYERDHPASLSQAGDTLISAGWAADLCWEITLPAGRYRVSILAGDALAAPGQRFVVKVEGESALDFTATRTQRLVTQMVEVDLLDGRLTISAPDGVANTTLASVRITAVHDENGGSGGHVHGEDGGQWRGAAIER